jgi:hypothetical protein
MQDPRSITNLLEGNRRRGGLELVDDSGPRTTTAHDARSGAGRAPRIVTTARLTPTRCRGGRASVHVAVRVLPPQMPTAPDLEPLTLSGDVVTLMRQRARTADLCLVDAPA